MEGVSVCLSVLTIQSTLHLADFYVLLRNQGKCELLRSTVHTV